MMKRVTIGSAIGAFCATVAAAPALAAGSPPPVNPTTPLPSVFTASNVTVYSLRSAFDAAAGTTVTNTFEFTPTNTTVPSMGFASGQYTDANGTLFALSTLPPAGYTGPVDLNLLDSTYLPSTGSYIGTHYGSDVLGSNYSDIVITFDHAVTAFGLDFGSYGQGFTNKSDIFAFTAGALGTQTAYSAAGASSFFGFTSATAFNSVTIRTSNNTQRVYDNVAISAAAVPEPATWAMMLIGFGMIGAASRYRRRRVAFTVA